MWNLFNWMPEEGTTWAAEVDWINNFITNISVFCTVVITGVAIAFAIIYRRKTPDQETAYITHNVALEAVWTFIPTVIVLFVFFFGLKTYEQSRVVPANAMEINVDAYSWRWDFTYPNGKKTTNDLVVPLGEPVKLIMTSHDVIHSFFVPIMRIKEDVYKGNYSYMWFTPTKLGESHIFCAEYCGLQHSAMVGKLKVVTPEEYQDFLVDRQSGDAVELPPAEAGKQLFTNKACHTCHTVDGTRLVGPSFKDFFNSGPRTFTDGSTAEVDENYVAESILNPAAKVVAGYAPVMPPYQGQLNEKELAQLIAYLKTL